MKTARDKTVKVSDASVEIINSLCKRFDLTQKQIVSAAIQLLDKNVVVNGKVDIFPEEGKQRLPLDLARGSQSGDVRGAGRKTKGAKAK